ncbi:MAG: alpha/beta fold hydrolase [Acidimicrobiia bacterium]
MAVLHTHHFGNIAGEPILAVHGITGHGGRFRRCGEEGWPERRTIAVDLRGHGHSLPDAPWSIEQHVTDLLDTLDAHDIDSTDVIGHSYGGQIALYLLAAAPDRVRRLVLLDPAYARPGADGLGAALDAIAFTGWDSVEAATAARLAAVSASGADGVYEDLRHHLMVDDDGRYRLRFSRPAVVAGWGELSRPLPHISVTRPTLLVGATKAPFVTTERTEELRGALGDQLCTTTLPCGHLVYWEDFEGTVAAVDGFLAR